MHKQVNKLSDEDIVRIILASRSHEKFGVLYDRYSTKVYHKCITFVKDTDKAKDLTHDIFLKVFINLSKFSYKAKFSTWLYSVTYNFCVDYVRKNSKVYFEPEEKLANIPDDLDDENERQLLQIKAKKLKRVMDVLPPEDKMVLLMKYQDELSISDLMATLDMKESAVKMKVKRARAKALDVYYKMYGNE